MGVASPNPAVVLQGSINLKTTEALGITNNMGMHAWTGGCY
jgi:hypothetical protein